MKIRRYHHGLHVWITQGKEGQLCYIGGCGPFKKIYFVPTDKDDGFHG
jgi:hypothetical protein